MKASELSLEEVTYTMSCNTYPARSHYKFVMGLGRVFPTTKAQAKHFVSNEVCFGVLNAQDVSLIEDLLCKHNFIGEYKYTKSKAWVRLLNHSDFNQALIKEYGV